MPFARGKPKTGGRKAQVPNKTTKAAREALQLAFDQIGGVAALTTWAMLNQTEFYKLYARLIPIEVGGSNDAPIITKIILCGPDE